MVPHNHRNTIEYSDGTILSHHHLEGEQHLIRLQAPQIAATARAGSFVHLTVAPSLPLRRPLSIMRVDPTAGWIEILYKRLGEGTTLLSQRQIGEKISLLGPIGNGFQLNRDRPRPLLLGGGVGMPPMVFLADQLRGDEGYHPLVILGSEVPFPFNPQPSAIMVSGLEPEVIAAMPLLEAWGVPSRLTSNQGFSGCFSGYVPDLARIWLRSLAPEQLQEVEIFSCGPEPMLEAVAHLAREFALPCQVSLEEFMACGVGGCAGCVVEVTTTKGKAMRRVCVDGPVFAAAEVF
ncbi:MAG: dihydroorotate dehydrogenase electron transfer subunit [Gammaproteobacteria bacterium]|nr:dihydroorotate dehydrogenase electron transfer subunit [Gammaproteobacteria bacterium]